MKSTVNQTHIRSINQRVILDFISKIDTISRASLSRKINLSKVAINENLTSLLDLGIVKEVGTGKSKASGGRKPILMQFNKEYKYIIAVDLRYEDTIFSLANIAGEIQNKFNIQISSTTPYSVRAELVKNAISILMSSHNLQIDDIAIIAISAPGIIHPRDAIYQANEQFKNWQMGDLSKELEDCFSTDVLILNDVNAAAIGESNHGAGRESQSMLYISCGLGIGAGIILNGKLHEGERSSAGEIGNFIVDASSDSPINLEKQVKVSSLINRIKQEAPRETLSALGYPKEFTFKEVVRLWEEGDDFIDECVKDIARSIGVAISNIISLLDVNLIILGGEYIVFSRTTIPIINQIVEATAFRPVPVVQSDLKYNGSIYGLLTIAKDKIFNQICNQNIK
jgi:predicted NBD/HSP70 family sugar kinase